MTLSRILLSTFLCTAASVQAQSTLFRCVDDKGVTHYGETMPAACEKKDVTEISKQGRTIRKLDAPLTPEQVAENEGRRNRAALLRTFEGATLTRANFCALKGISDAALEAQLVQAREERKHQPQPHPHPHPQPQPQPPQRPQNDRDRPSQGRPRTDDRGPRRGPASGRPPR